MTGEITVLLPLPPSIPSAHPAQFAHPIIVTAGRQERDFGYYRSSADEILNLDPRGAPIQDMVLQVDGA
jgi:hypothetical protein